MAQKRAPQKRRAPARAAAKPKTRTRTVTKYKTRYRNPVGSARNKKMTEYIKNGVGNGLGFVAVRTASNIIMPDATGYKRAGVDAAIGIGGGLVANGMKADPKIVASIVTGAITSAAIRIVDMLSGGRYIQLGETGMGAYRYSPPRMVGMNGYRRVPGVAPLIPFPVAAPVAINGVRDNVRLSGVGRSPWNRR